MPTNALPAGTAPLASTQTVTHQLPRHRRSVGRAREALRHQLANWHIGADITESATLLLSELTTNAINAKTTRGREIGVRFVLTGLELRIEVSDTNDEQPTLKHAEDDDESGRGLALVDSLADRWGVEPRDAVGKVVWALLVLPEGDTSHR
ncbi:ATP-binding protein [Streptomyces sp. NA02950]|uniref:ATP-binding protein n=1 Tax=Streptomyces sp. NA02950 TaxID=2742137 RepID=UPI001591D233|nr:ATP-binding protein [Streptomyces sp. NA02950]QKV94163.1 ATP-binding protein [Streptomyces sp. NA02950]